MQQTLHMRNWIQYSYEDNPAMSHRTDTQLGCFRGKEISFPRRIEVQIVSGGGQVTVP